MNKIVSRWIDAHRRWWMLALIALIALPVGLVTAQQAFLDRNSPATGHAQVVTQGIDDLPDGEVVWRVVERTASPRTEAQPGRRVLGFVLATEDPVLLTNITEDGQVDVARLAPGESFLVTAGTRQIRASLTDQEVTYLTFELVAAEDADDTNGGKLLFVSDEFTAPDGKRDIDLVRNVLAAGEQASVPDTGESVAILATEGAIDILPSGGRGRTLEAGESAIFEPGELEIEAVGTTATAAGVRAQIATLTNSLQGDDDGNAAYIIAVIGPEIPPPPIQPLPTETATEVPPIEEPEAVTGSITLYVYDCPEGMTLETLVPEYCVVSRGGYDFVLGGPIGEVGLAQAIDLGGAWLWQELPLGAYYLYESILPDGYMTYFIPGSAAVGGSADEGYSVAIDESAPDIGLNVFHLQSAPKSGSITVELFLCPDNQIAGDYNPADCTMATGGYAVSLFSFETNNRYDMSAASGTTWSDLPLGTYFVVVDFLPRGWTEYLAPDGRIYVEGEGGAVEIGGNYEPSTYVALYAFTSSTD